MQIMTERTNKDKWLVILISMVIIAIVGIVVTQLRQRVTLNQRADFQDKEIECRWTSSMTGNIDFSVAILDPLLPATPLVETTISRTVNSVSDEIVYTFTGVNLDIPTDGSRDVVCQVSATRVEGQTCTNTVTPPQSEPGSCFYTSPPLPSSSPTPSPTSTPTVTSTITPTPTGSLGCYQSCNPTLPNQCEPNLQCVQNANCPTPPQGGGLCYWCYAVSCPVTPTATPTSTPTATPTVTSTPTPSIACPANTSLNVEIICPNCNTP